MTPTLYGCYRSRATRNFWLAGELNITLKVVPVIQHYRLPASQSDQPLNTRSPGFLAISPMGAIPVLTDGDLVLTESLAINIYLAKKYGGPLAPQDAAEDALMTQWALYGMTAVEPHTLPIMYAHAEGRAAVEPGLSEVATHADALRRPFAALEVHLADNDGHMIKRGFTVADINMAECVRYAQSHPTLLSEFPGVTAWMDRCQSRPAFGAMMAAREKEPITP